MKQKLKKKKSVSGLFLLLALVFSNFSVSNAQAQKQISGIVTDQGGIPLPGVNILQQNTSNGVVTDFDGKYSISLQQGNKVLVFSYVGFKEKVITVGDKSSLDITLDEDIAGLEEVVVIGYAPVAREKILGAVSTVKAESIEQATPVQAFDAVQGKLSGVQILSNNGPGQGFDIRIRGVGTFESGTGPLFVVDGQQLDNIDNIDPADIESLEVLKDGATTAIYGSRGANGVVLVTTKSGKAGKLKVDVRTTTGVNTLVGDLPIANTEQRIIYEKLRSANATALNGRELDSLSLLVRNSFDLQKLLIRPAIRHSSNIALSGGNNTSNFYWNTGFINEDGIVSNSGYKRINTQLKINVIPSDKFKAGTSLNLSSEERKGINSGAVLSQLTQRIAYFPLFNPDGSFTPTLFGRQNPLAQAELRTINDRDFRGRLFNYAQLQLLPNLSVKSTLGVNFRLRKRNDFTPGILRGNDGLGDTQGRERIFLGYDIQQENFLNYNNTWGGHELAAFAGMQIQRNFRESSDISSTIFNNDLISTFNNAAPTTITANNSGDSRNNLYSLFTGFSYDYKGRYLVSGTFRRDGSSRFGADNKFGYFPSFQLGWNLSKEAFLEDSNVVDNLLIRGSWGIVGNERIQDYEFTGALEPGFGYPGIDGVSGIAPTRLGNTELRWEETVSRNIGFDLTMFNRRLDINFDLWERDTDGLLSRTPLPEETGFTQIRRNVGVVRNRGLDFNIAGTIIRNKKFTWRSSFNIGLLENEVLKLSGGTPFDSGAYRVEEGQPIGNVFGYKNLGVYAYDESNAYTPDGERLTPVFDDNGVFQNYTRNGQVYNDVVEQQTEAGRILRGGDVIWEDVDGNLDIDQDDRQIIGNGLATVFGGFSNSFKYKNFTASLLFDYSLNNDVYRRYDEQRDTQIRPTNNTPSPNRILQAWTTQGDQTVYPRVERRNEIRPNSFYVTDGSFIKLRYIRFNYALPNKFLKNLSFVKRASLNLAVNNVLTWTNYEGYNPELGSRGNPLQQGLDNLRFPNDREILLGLRVQF